MAKLASKTAIKTFNQAYEDASIQTFAYCIFSAPVVSTLSTTSRWLIDKSFQLGVNMKRISEHMLSPYKIHNFKIILSILILLSLVLFVLGLITYIEQQEIWRYLIVSSCVSFVFPVCLFCWQFFYCKYSIEVLNTNDYKSGKIYIKTPFKKKEYQITDIKWYVKRVGFRSPNYRIYLMHNNKKVFSFQLDYWSNALFILQLPHKELNTNVIKDLRNRYGYFI